ncbi:MAG: carboxypeptidase-like regulatory domain-containing protein, partial [Bacteroidetes bacterium]|nr:carboxypeptidase-like regulatory domain-containing protein [Bacteroidota bacterium]
MNSRFVISFFAITFFILCRGYSQQTAQVIRGTVIDRQSQVTLPGANVILLNSEPRIGASTGVDGNFKISGVLPGRYDLQATFLGYKPVIISSIVVTAGKEVV